MGQIFISHINEESAVAEAVVRFLREFELSAFLSSDNWQVRAGERWFDRVTTELKDSKVVILLLSEQSVARAWINFEAGWGWGAGKKVMPVCFGGLSKGKMPRPYSDLQGLNLRSDFYDLLKDCYHYIQPTRICPPPFLEDSPAAAELISALDGFDSARSKQ